MEEKKISILILFLKITEEEVKRRRKTPVTEKFSYFAIANGHLSFTSSKSPYTLSFK